MTTYIVVDTFRSALVSSHRTIATAVKGQRKYGKACPTLPTAVLAVDKRRGSDSLYDSRRDLTEREIEIYEREAGI